MPIDQRLTDLFRSIFNDDTIELRPETNADHIEGWDSIAHIQLIFAIEEEFNLQFSTRDLESMQNVGDLQSILLERSR